VPIQNTSDLMTKEDIDALAPLVNNFNEVIKNNVGKRENLRDALKAAVPNATQKQKNFLDTVGDLIQDNYDYAPQNTHLQDITSYLSDDYLASYNEIAADAGPGAIGSMVRSDGVQKWYETTVSPTVQKLAKQLGTTAKRVSKDGIDYEVIDLRTPGVKEKADSAFKLYAGGGVLAYYMAMAQGYTPSEISKYMEEQGFSEDEIQDAKANWKKAKEAKKAGKSDEEINAMFGTNMTIKE
jgi:hypothetical protein